ncbi:MAG: ABC transporter substrate-binding protein, partial [Patescibacteria group bacterium]|nr:ABC transporter substrate-binding protein [Patescibacteria group bacterium]
MSKTLQTILGIVALVILTGAIWYGVSRKPAEEGVIKIGVISPLTGLAAEYGTETQKGLDLAVEELNKKGGVNGKQIKLIKIVRNKVSGDRITPFPRLSKPSKRLFLFY